MAKIALKKSDLPAMGEYSVFLDKIKNDIVQTQLCAAQTVTRELVMLYWRIGKNLSEKAQKEGWGSKVVITLARDIKIAFPGLKGFSLRNLHYMRRLYEAYSDINCATAVAQLPWGHNVTLLEKLKSNDQRLWYANYTLQKGWSRGTLMIYIESDLYTRQGKSVTNFHERLPQPTSGLAQETLKDPYNFSFLMLEDEAHELEIERGLTNHIERFLLEIGKGFAFMGRQYHLNIGGDDIYIDMLFYHVDLRCFIVVELKAKKFDARDVGQINMYLSAVDDLVRRPGDNPSIGILLCKEKNIYMAEYALRDINKPIGVSNYYTAKITESLPKEFKGKLPTIEEIEAELEKGSNIEEKEEKKKGK